MTYLQGWVRSSSSEKVCRKYRKTHTYGPGGSQDLIGSESRVVKGWPECQDGMGLSTVTDRDGNCRDVSEEDSCVFGS